MWRWRSGSWRKNWPTSAGHVEERYIWAVLDCPSYFGLCEPRPLALLARLSASIDIAGDA